MIRKFFSLDKNYLLEEAQLTLQDELLTALIQKARSQYEIQHNPLGIRDSFSTRILEYKPRSLKPLYSFYQTLAGIYRYRYGSNQLEFLWDGKSHVDEYRKQWASAFDAWMETLLKKHQFLQAVLDLSVFLSENRHAHLAENRMNYVMLDFFSEQEGFPELKIRKSGVLEMVA